MDSHFLSQLLHKATVACTASNYLHILFKISKNKGNDFKRMFPKGGKIVWN